jgi:hypothetical protein
MKELDDQTVFETVKSMLAKKKNREAVEPLRRDSQIVL